jgi:hypothetical protein
VPLDFLHRRFITSHGTPSRKPSPPPRRLTEGAPPPPSGTGLCPGPRPAAVAAEGRRSVGGCSWRGRRVLRHRPGGGRERMRAAARSWEEDGQLVLSASIY